MPVQVARCGVVFSMLASQQIFVMKHDLITSNGVVHLVNSVLRPPGEGTTYDLGIVSLKSMFGDSSR